MAETTGKETPATDPKTAAPAAAKTGPVKPPVLEGTARPAGTGKPGDASTTEKPAEKSAASTTSKPTTPSTAARSRVDDHEENSGGAWLAGILGGVIGLGAAYGLAWFGLWPQVQQAPAPADPRLAQFATAIPELETVTGTVQDELSTLTARVGTLEASLAEAPVATAPGTDPALAEQLAALSARLDALDAAPGNTVDADTLAGMQSALEAVQSEMSATATQLNAARQQIETLSRNADESTGAEAATMRLPLIFSSLESAFSAGRGYETELAALRQALPETMVPEAIAGRAASGLPRPDDVERQLVAVLPDMLAGRPVNAGANWQDATTDWFRGLIAMRPAGAIEGDGADAIIARLEAAVAQRDFETAEAELTALPAPMRDAAGALADDIASLAAAETFLTQLRARALTGENGA
ncbi:hypothetical protein NIM87_04890 [Devosia sp. XJ19-1]|uniref:COG4223 family protein n=1 Tax=Devosia ureilytica TaxID=2952754 RepID=UPI0020C7F090|nr:hypothetical protein [Devosia ureilytica]MCP8882825.1 hypothetical protein [Devosia ureilytica]